MDKICFFYFELAVLEQIKSKILHFVWLSLRLLWQRQELVTQIVTQTAVAKDGKFEFIFIKSCRSE